MKKQLNLVSLLGLCFSLAQEYKADQFSGTLSSPNYPHDYPNNAFVSRVLTAPSTSEGLIQLCFRDFQTEDKYDWLKVYDVQTTNVSTRLYHFSGSGPRIKCLPTQSRKVKLTFRSDSSLTKHGYILDYSLMPNNDTGIPSPIGELTYSNLSQRGAIDIVAPSHLDGFIQLYLGASPLDVFFWQLLIYNVQNTSLSLIQLVNLDAARSFPKYIYTRMRHIKLIASSRGQYPLDSSTDRSQIRLPWGLYSTLNGTEMVPPNKELPIAFAWHNYRQTVLMGQHDSGQAFWLFFRYSNPVAEQRFTEEVIQMDRRYSSFSGCIRISFRFSWETYGPGGLQLVYQSASVPDLWQAAWQSRVTKGSEWATVKIYSRDVIIAFRGTWGGKYRVDDVSISGCNYVTTPQTTPRPSPTLRIYRRSQGTLTSPGYPTSYPPNADIRWRIISHTSITLVFRSFETEKRHDTLKVYDFSRSSRLIRTFSGRLPQGYNYMISYTRTIELRFSSDSNKQLAGFWIQWQPPRSVTTVQPIRPERDVVLSPGYPYSFPASSYESWDIIENSEIYLLFEEFDTEHGVHKLRVYELVTRERGSLVISDHLKTFTGYLAPNTCYATGRDHVRLTFASSSTRNKHYRGFKIRYTTERPSTCKESNVGQIVGITIGVLGFLIMSCASFLACRRRTANSAAANSQNMGGHVSLTNLVPVSDSAHQGVDGLYNERHHPADHTSDGPPTYSEIHHYSRPTVQPDDPPAYEQAAGILQDDARNKPQEIVPPPPAYNDAVPVVPTDSMSRDTNNSATGTTLSSYCEATEIASTAATCGPSQGECDNQTAQESPHETSI